MIDKFIERLERSNCVGTCRVGELNDIAEELGGKRCIVEMSDVGTVNIYLCQLAIRKVLRGGCSE